MGHNHLVEAAMSKNEKFEIKVKITLKDHLTCLQKTTSYIIFHG